MSLRLMVLLFSTLLSVLPEAHAWGNRQHRVVGLLAAKQLRPAAQAEVQRLLAGEAEPTLAGISRWADDVRAAQFGRPNTGRLHYVNFRGGACSYVPARDCANGQCVIAAINRQFLILADRARPDDERRDALKNLVHFVADVHQPLHATPILDRGGGDFQIFFHGKGRNLHGLWDAMVAAPEGLSPEAHADQLAARSPLPMDATRRSDQPAVDWAVESCRLVSGLYPPGHVIDETYVQEHRPLAELRLRQAAARLADMLNYALAPAG